MKTAQAVLPLTRSRVADYIELTKPRIAVLVLFTVAAGFWHGHTGPLEIWLLIHAVVGTGLLVLLAAVVWPLLYAVAFYDDPNKNKPPVDGEDAAPADELEEDTPKTPRSESFEEDDVDVFEREGVTAESEEAENDEDFEPAETGDEFDVEEESIESAETADFDLGDDEFADLEIEEEVEEEEEVPKKKAKKKKK